MEVFVEEVVVVVAAAEEEAVVVAVAVVGEAVVGEEPACLVCGRQVLTCDGERSAAEHPAEPLQLPILCLAKKHIEKKG